MFICSSYFILEGGDKTNNVWDKACTQNHTFLVGYELTSANDTQTLWYYFIFYTIFFDK